MPGIDPKFICHHLSISSGFRPVAQQRRKLGEEKRKVVHEETKKLFTANFICEIQYSIWLANMDEAKIAFITDAGDYCYKVMPFRFKNAGATYQHMMD
ncbi:hypothetical protein CR513_52840, partial [Mucuna pruriens]